MPLSWCGLCDAVIIKDISTSKFCVSSVKRGVGTIPKDITETPFDVKPAVRADSSISPEMRVSLPMATFFFSKQAKLLKTFAKLNAKNAFIG